MKNRINKFGRTAAVTAAIGLLASGCASKSSRTEADRQSSRSDTTMSSDTSSYPYGGSGTGGTGETGGLGGSGLGLDTTYQRDTSWNRSDTSWRNPSGSPGTGLPGSSGEGGAGLDAGGRGPDSMNRGSDTGLAPYGYPGTGTGGAGGSGTGGTGGGWIQSGPDSIRTDTVEGMDTLRGSDWDSRG